MMIVCVSKNETPPILGTLPNASSALILCKHIIALDSLNVAMMHSRARFDRVSFLLVVGNGEVRRFVQQ